MGAYRGLLFKEWIKIRWVLLIVTGITLWTHVDLLLSTRELFEFVAPVKIWENAIQRQMLFYSGIEYNAIIAGVALALVQFVPETRRRRLRLLFHLPVGHVRSLYFMISTGLLFLLFVIAVNTAGLLLVVPAYYPAEIVRSALVTAAPWFLAGIVAYLGTVLVVVEPAWWRKILYAAVVYGLTILYLEGRGYSTYELSLWKYALLGALCLFTVILPGYRFKRGIS